MSKVKIKVKRPWIGYSGSTLQQNYAEDLEHGFLLWDIRSHKDFDVSFKTLPNPKPFVTIDWCGNVNDTLKLALNYSSGTRFRIRSSSKIPSKDSTLLTETLKKEHKASEVIFKDDYSNVDKTQVSAGHTTIVKEDLRNPDVLLKLLQEHYSGADMQQEEWHSIYDLLKKYVGMIVTETQARNISWSLRRLEFSNLFGYGEGNIINFDTLTGLVGIFGPNRSGKSSIPGALMYTLYNSTDRGVIKNKNIVNSRSDFGQGRVVFNVNGVDFVAQRKTTKSITKKGDVNANTELQLYRILDDMELDEKSGEHRPDTDKILKALIGDKDDFLLTSLSSQGDSNVFLNHGPSKRRQILSRFLDIDVLHRIHDLANQDVRDLKAALRLMRDLDWDDEEKKKRSKITTCNETIQTLSTQIEELTSELHRLKMALALHKDIIPVTKEEVQSQEEKVKKIRERLSNKRQKENETNIALDEIKQKIIRLDSLLEQYNLIDMKNSIEAHNKMKVMLDALKSTFITEDDTLNRHKKTLKILEDVPCGDLYPTCKFIKDAHQTKSLLQPQIDKVDNARVAFEDAKKALIKIDIKSLNENVKKIEKLKDRHSQLTINESKLMTEIVRLSTDVQLLNSELQQSLLKLDELRDAHFNDENEEVASLKLKITQIEQQLRNQEKQRMQFAADHGKYQSELEQLLYDRNKRLSTLRDMKAHEVISIGFSKKGVPNLIVSSQLPIINEEISKILNGIVNFTVELERDEDTDQVDIMLNYGDSKRILELGSGHEKMISSIALRVALINCSSLPKSDFFIIDEGFGAFDSQGIEECNRLLQSLKRHFKAVIVITHVDGVKDIVDTMIEITKSEKDSRVNFD